jgi:serine/threonine protein kinase
MELETREDALIGTTLDNRYKIDSIIGRGGMSTVYKAQHLFLHRDVAIKIMQEHLASNVEGRMRFQREAQAAASLSHPNIISVTEFGVATGGEPYMVMDYLDGKSLADVLRDKMRAEPPLALLIFKQVAAALQHAHEKSIVHRDLKPSNVMLTRGERDNSLMVKVVDFGLARFLPGAGKDQRRLTAAGELVGSPYYMSPEQIRDEELDARSDIYAFGCLMYETLTGVRPFMDTNAITVLSMHLYEPPPPFSEVLSPNRIPPELENIVLKCLEKNRSKRYQTMLALAADLATVKDWTDGPSRSTPYVPPANKIAEASGPHVSLHVRNRGAGAIDPAAESGGTADYKDFTLRLQQPDFAKKKKEDWIRKLKDLFLKWLVTKMKPVIAQFEGKGVEARKQRMLGTKVLVAVFGHDDELNAKAELDCSKYQVYYPNVELRKSLDAQAFLVHLSTEQYDIVHLLGKYDKRAIFNDQTGFQLRLSDVKRACDYAKVKMLWLATDNDLEVIKDNAVLQSPSFHLILTKARGENFPKFLSGLLSRLARGEAVATAWESFVPHAQYKGDKVNCKFFHGLSDISFYP